MLWDKIVLRKSQLLSFIAEGIIWLDLDGSPCFWVQYLKQCIILAFILRPILQILWEDVLRFELTILIFFKMVLDLCPLFCFFKSVCVFVRVICSLIHLKYFIKIKCFKYIN